MYKFPQPTCTKNNNNKFAQKLNIVDKMIESNKNVQWLLKFNLAIHTLEHGARNKGDSGQNLPITNSLTNVYAKERGICTVETGLLFGPFRLSVKDWILELDRFCGNI